MNKQRINLSILLVLALFFSINSVYSQVFDGPQCTSDLKDLGQPCLFSSECKCGTPAVDFMFIVDATGSMANEIAAVKNGLKQFITTLNNNKKIDARYSYVLYGCSTTNINPSASSTGAEYIVPWTKDPNFMIWAFGNTSVNGATTGWHSSHSQSPENAFETFRMLLGAANTTARFKRGPKLVAADNMNWREGALKYFIHVTDEDSDRPFDPANRFGEPQTSGSYDPNPADWYNLPTNGYYKEMDWAIKNLVKNKIAYSGFVNPPNGSTRQQFGDPAKAVQNADFSGFNRAATIANLEAQFPRSMWLTLLKANLTARMFDITKIDDAGVIANFFNEVTKSVLCDATSSCPCGQVDQCVGGGTTGGGLGTCQANTNMACSPNFDQCDTASYCKFDVVAGGSQECLFDGQTYDSSDCRACKPEATTGAWSSNCVSTDSCIAATCNMGTGVCQYTEINSDECTCIIDGVTYRKGDTKPGFPNLICDPATDRFDWTDPENPPKDCSPGVCSPSTECLIASCNKTVGCFYTPVNNSDCTCVIDGVWYTKGDINPNDGNLVCDPGHNRFEWTELADVANCDQFEDCASCIYQKQYCGWCGTTEKCIPGNTNGPRNATCPNWVFDTSRILATPGDDGRVKPTNIDVFLRPGVLTSVDVTITRPPIPPLDFVLLSDASGSMGPFVGLVASSANAISNALQSFSSDTKLGLVSFLDKPIQPRAFHPWSWVYKPLVSLTYNITAFQKGAEDFLTTINYDNDESGLEAIMLTAHDTTGQVAWRDYSYRIVMLASDTRSYEGGAGDSEPWIGLQLIPNNGDGIPDGDPPGTGEDYPTRQQVRQVLLEKKVSPVFAAPPGDVFGWYKALVRDFGFGGVVPFEDGSEQLMIEGIINGINNNLGTVSLAVEKDVHKRIKSITPASFSNVNVGQSVTFKVTFEAKEGDSNYEDDTTAILRFVGYPSTVSVLVKTKQVCLGCDVNNVTAVLDKCGVCGGNGKSCTGCDGLVNSELKFDICGVCGGDNTSCIGCDGIANSGVDLDICGECGGNGSTCVGCDGIPNSGVVINPCGVCGGEQNCILVQDAIVGLSVGAAVAVVLALLALLFLLISRHQMLKVDEILYSQLDSIQQNPLYRQQGRSGANPFYKGNQMELSKM